MKRKARNRIHKHNSGSQTTKKLHWHNTILNNLFLEPLMYILDHSTFIELMEKLCNLFSVEGPIVI